MKKLLLIIFSIYLFSCSKPSDNAQQQENEISTSTKIDLLKGQWTLDLNNIDKNSNPSSREKELDLKLKNNALEVLNLYSYTFFGDGNGILRHISSKSSAGAITEKQFKNLSFKYKLDGEYISLTGSDSTSVKLFKIVDKGINNDYLEVVVIPFKKDSITYGLYKIGEYN